MACPNRNLGGAGGRWGWKKKNSYTCICTKKNTETRYYSHNYIAVCKKVTIIWKKVKKSINFYKLCYRICINIFWVSYNIICYSIQSALYSIDRGDVHVYSDTL